MLRNNDFGTTQGGLQARHGPKSLFHNLFRNQASTRDPSITVAAHSTEGKSVEVKKKLAKILAENAKDTESVGDYDDVREIGHMAQSAWRNEEETADDPHLGDFNERMEEQRRKIGHQKGEAPEESQGTVTSVPAPQKQPNVVQNAFDRMRPNRTESEVATIIVGDKITTTVIGSQLQRTVQISEQDAPARRWKRPKAASELASATQKFSQSLREFTAPGAHHAPVNGLDSEELSISIGGVNSVGSGSSDEETVPHVESKIRQSDSESFSEEELVDDDLYGKRPHTPSSDSNPDTDDDYVDEAEKKAEEEARVAELIRTAEESVALPNKDSVKRANKVLRSGFHKDSTTSLLTRIDSSLEKLQQSIHHSEGSMLRFQQDQSESKNGDGIIVESEEERLSLTVSKDDFANMNIVGQFNLGFILAVRPPTIFPTRDARDPGSEELFIIDQHASDEKFNFERLQADTVVGNQRLVRAMMLDLTAVEEEIVMENMAALEKNGFVVEVDTSDGQPTGQRCRLVSLPLSKEVVFNTKDLDELIHLLAESPTVSAESSVPRPSKVRKMFAMRACRSSIMIGKTLTQKQMDLLVKNMGTIDKPWNCPHGRPTMRHLMSLASFDAWDEASCGKSASPEASEAEIWSRYGW